MEIVKKKRVGASRFYYASRDYRKRPDEFLVDVTMYGDDGDPDMLVEMKKTMPKMQLAHIVTGIIDVISYQSKIKMVIRCHAGHTRSAFVAYILSLVLDGSIPVELPTEMSDVMKEKIYDVLSVVSAVYTTRRFGARLPM